MYLLYCIFYSNEIQTQTILAGVGGQPVFLISTNGIGSAVSEILDAHQVPDIPQVIEYKKVMESFHSDRTIIPVRYGCVLRDRSQVIELLKKNASYYKALLKELDSCVEMGIRLMIDDAEISVADFYGNDPAPGFSGKTYLAARKHHYALEDCVTKAKVKIAGQLRSALTGLFVNCRIETPSMLDRRSPMLSLYFLVPGKSLAPFRRAFEHMRLRMKTTKFFLSGPWPPYNFVLPENEQHRADLLDNDEKTGDSEP
ncbi:MAG: GvpL/GvpF family gas vesicle protein [Pseudomonadota bacterium]